MPQLIKLATGQVTVLPGTRYLLWAKDGEVTIRCHPDGWSIFAPYARDGATVALVANADGVGWLPLVAHGGELAAPPYAMGRVYGVRSEGSQPHTWKAP